MAWEEPEFTAFFHTLGWHARVILFDKRGVGLPDRIQGAPSLDDTLGDARRILDAVGSKRTYVMGTSQGSAAAVQALTGQTTVARHVPDDRRPGGRRHHHGGDRLRRPARPVPRAITFTRTLTGRDGSLTVTGSASLAFTSQTAATITGSWRVASGTGAYARASGSGSLTGSADFGAAPPTASLPYAGEIEK